VPLDDFDGFFTTLVCKADATRFNLPFYPCQPEAIQGPPADGEEGRGARNARPVAGSLERLNWTAVGGDNDDDVPMIGMLPQFLPIGPGQTFPHHHPLVSDATFRDSFPLLEVWRKGIVYARDHNGNNLLLKAARCFTLRVWPSLPTRPIPPKTSMSGRFYSDPLTSFVLTTLASPRWRQPSVLGLIRCGLN